jgi:hypothetical protein
MSEVEEYTTLLRNLRTTPEATRLKDRSGMGRALTLPVFHCRCERSGSRSSRHGML